MTTPGEPREKTEVKPAVPLKRKIGTISAAGPTYKGIDLIKNRQIICRLVNVGPRICLAEIWLQTKFLLALV